MNEPLTNRPVDEMTLDESLQAVLTRPPDPAFVDALEQRLLARQRVAPAPTVERRKSLWTRWRDWWAGVRQRAPRLRWAAVPVTVLALLLVALLLIGPERAWAGLQAWLGYVPGVGFVDLDESRLLANPARVTREGVTLEVVEVVAGPEDTVVVVEIEGLPPQDRFRPQDMPPSTETQPVLRLPGGETLTATGVSASRSQATFVFPALPAGIYHVTLELARLPLVPAGAALEEWKVALLLQPANGELVAEMYPQPYRPEGATDTQHAITLSVLEVAHTGTETALLVQAGWQDARWKWNGLEGAGTEGAPLLSGEDGSVYEAIPPRSQPVRVELGVIDPSLTPTPPPPGAVREDTAWFAPIAPSTKRLTLRVEQLWFMAEPSGSFTLDLGSDAQFGRRWPLDVALDVGGFPVHISGVRLEEGAKEVPFKLVFETEAEQDDRRRLESVILGLARDVTDFGNAAHSATTFYSRAGKLEPTISLAALPASPFAIVIASATMAVEGPWQVTWQVPGNADTAQSRGTPTQSYAPRDASATQAGITVSVLAAAHGEEEIALQVRAHWNEPGWRFNGFWVAEPEPRLRDEQGNVYERSLNANLPLRVTEEARNPAVTPSPPPGGYTDETTFLFAPVPAGVETLTLEVEALGFHQNASGELQLDLGPAPRVGQRWPLDETWTIAGYPVHVRSVQLLQSSDHGLPYQLVFDMDVDQPDDGTVLMGLLLESDFNYYGSTGGNTQREGVLAPALLLPDIPDRPFTVSADAASLVVEGPWEVTWVVPK
jgi:hypothetical protein